MYLQNLSLKNFRVFSEIDLTFNNGINIISGPNGQGKTSILEAIYYLALTRSFKSSNDKNVINHNKNYFKISGSFSDESNRITKILLSYERNGKKNLLFKKKKVKKFSEYIGTIPCIILTLEDLKLTFGYPSARRKFMDILLSQVSKVYLQNLKAYKRVVQHRNKILNDEFASRNNKNIEIWDEQLIEYGSFILEKRYELVDFLNSNMSEYYQKFSKQKENIIVDYKSCLEKINSSNTKEKIKNIFKSNLKIIRNEEREKRVTLIGPHRDDLEFLKDGKSFKEYGSQGENKTLVIVLKILELIFVTDYVKKNPITLLDDIFGELDKSRMNGLLQFLKSIGQSFITTTIEEKFSDLDDKSNIKLENLIVNYA